MPDDEHQDWEAWQRKIYEGLWPIDPKALFWVGLLEIDFREAPGHRFEDFPVDDLCQCCAVEGVADGGWVPATAALRGGDAIEKGPQRRPFDPAPTDLIPSSGVSWVRGMIR